MRFKKIQTKPACQPSGLLAWKLQDTIANNIEMQNFFKSWRLIFVGNLVKV
jgi:hypothetical protein